MRFGGSGDSAHSGSMAQDRRKRPRDFSQAAKLVIDIATGRIEDRPPTPEQQGKDPAAVAFEASQKRAA
jgi:hypothetical protein